MDRTNTPTASRVREADLAAATAHLKESLEHGREAAHGAKRIARETWNDFSRNVDRYVESRPRTVALWLLGSGLAVGFLAGLLASRAVGSRPASG